MSERPEDPTNTRYMADSYANSVTHQLDLIEGTLLAQEDAELMFGLSMTMLANFTDWWFGDLPFWTDWSVRIGIDDAVMRLNQLGPDFRASPDWLPIDSAFRDEALELQQGYITNLNGELIVRLRAHIQAGMSMEDLAIKLHEDFNFARNRANQIARTELLRHYNTTARRRYQSWGVNRYGFLAHANACTEPKKLRDGSIVRGGCTELHGREFPIDDEVHCPPIHPLGRCTIVPKL